MRKICIAFLIMVVAVASCVTKEGTSNKISSFAVTITKGEKGSEANPLPFSADTLYDYILSAKAIGRKGEIFTAFSGNTRIRVGPSGLLVTGSGRTIEAVFKNGVADGIQISIKRAHGPIRIWIEDNGTDEIPGSYATGISEPIYFRNPTIVQIQTTDNPELSAIQGDEVKVDVKGRKVVVTGKSVDGFYITDTSESTIDFASIYVYTFNLPDIEVGDVLASLAGNVDEYYGFTEISYPIFKIDEGVSVTLPKPEELNATMVADPITLEKLESASVVAHNVWVCPLNSDFAKYNQWRVSLDTTPGCSDETKLINVLTPSGFTFTPKGHEGIKIACIKGFMRQHVAATPQFMIAPLTDSDLSLESECQ